MLDVREHMLILLPQNLKHSQSCTNSTAGAFNDFYSFHFLKLTIFRFKNSGYHHYHYTYCEISYYKMFK